MALQAPQSSPWRDCAPPSLSGTQKHWLFRPGALTAGLRQLGVLRLRVVREHYNGLLPAEAWMVGRRPGSPVWIREIIMSIDGIDTVFARSITPLNASHGIWREMRGLRTRPLADMLYHDPEIRRSRFFTCRLGRQSPLYRSAQRMFGSQCPSPRAMHARSSIFWRRGQALVVAECFLPAFWERAHRAGFI